MSQFRCPFCQVPIRGAGPAARAFVFNVVTRKVALEAKQLRAGDVLVVVDSTVHPEDHAIHRCDDPRGTMVMNWFRNRATEVYSAINAAIRKDIERYVRVPQDNVSV
jgi:hypothetical protein